MKTSIWVALFAAAAFISGCDDETQDGDIPKECDEYLKTVEKCMKNVPAEARTSFERGVKVQRDAIKAATTPEARRALREGCKTALDAMKQKPVCK